MATSKIMFEHPTSVNLGSITATDEKDFLSQIADKIENFPVNIPGVFRAVYVGHYQTYGYYNNAGTSVWVTVTKGHRIMQVFKDGADYYFYAVDLTEM